MQYFNLASKKDRLLGQWEALQEDYVQAYVESAAIPGDAGLCQLCLRDGKTISDAQTVDQWPYIVMIV